ncbi:L,D-transpeptidase [Streptomyces colonosanans]|uniref:L,D-transpeptidase n=1 Tax=Streptomyces colonosanans TaxID=1428652 RepID=UPI0026C1E8CF
MVSTRMASRGAAVLLAVVTALPAATAVAASPAPPGALDPDVARKCPVRSYRVACIDLTHQLTWVQKGKKVIYGPVPVRTGAAGYKTRTGWHRIFWKHKNHWSSLYGTPMPYSQFFSGGQAFHAVDDDIDSGDGSYGCVNLRPAEARKLWGVLKVGDRVYVWGRKPGT